MKPTLKQVREYKAGNGKRPWQYYALSKEERAIWDNQEGYASLSWSEKQIWKNQQHKARYWERKARYWERKK